MTRDLVKEDEIEFAKVRYHHHCVYRDHCVDHDHCGHHDYLDHYDLGDHDHHGYHHHCDHDHDDVVRFWRTEPRMLKAR